ncbi:hypothetical protein Cgig2_001354 [Carnegiea gigantea]|uniref:Rho GDP-dissociation inhibitor 1 n=1 Tax=Carnegiea gigantea TaxID=171969 RepID=A0A9Q1QNW4_9CARY|nr:hypothetical protein Cgig2_001354 [Carnegiea gigantea]
MSITVRAVSASVDSSILSSNMKEEQHKNGKADNGDCELKEQHTCGDCTDKDLADEINQKPESDDELCTQVQGADPAADNSSLKLSSVLSVGPHEQVEKDKKDDRSLGDCKRQVLRDIDISTASESKEGEVKVLSMSILSPGRTDVVLAIPFPTTTSKATLFTLKEGSKYRTIFHFTVSNDIVHGLCYTYIFLFLMNADVNHAVCNIKKMMGTFSPREEPYTFELEEGTTPSGFFARGSFLVRSKFVDDDGKCYLDTTYYFDIRKDWGARDKC